LWWLRQVWKIILIERRSERDAAFWHIENNNTFAVEPQLPRLCSERIRLIAFQTTQGLVGFEQAAFEQAALEARCAEIISGETGTRPIEAAQRAASFTTMMSLCA